MSANQLPAADYRTRQYQSQAKRRCGRHPETVQDRLTSVVRISSERTLISTVVLHTGTLRASDTDDKSLFRIIARASEDLEFGFVVCLLPGQIFHYVT
jgi:hypothetical protein